MSAVPIGQPFVSGVPPVVSLTPQDVGVVEDAMPGPTTRDVLLPDERRPIADAGIPPWSLVCLLLIRDRRGVWRHATGWLAGPSTVFTAGHNLRYDRFGHEAVEVRVVPGCNGAPLHYRQLPAREWEMHPRWAAATQEATRDVGVVWFDPPPGPSLGHFGFQSFTDAQLSGAGFGLAGYPEDRPFGTLWYGDGPVMPAAGFIEYRIDTNGGQSGSPLFGQSPAGPVAAGIHVYGDRTRNLAVRIGPGVIEQLVSWWR